MQPTSLQSSEHIRRVDLPSSHRLPHPIPAARFVTSHATPQPLPPFAQLARLKQGTAGVFSAANCSQKHTGRKYQQEKGIYQCNVVVTFLRINSASFPKPNYASGRWICKENWMPIQNIDMIEGFTTRPWPRDQPHLRGQGQRGEQHLRRRWL